MLDFATDTQSELWTYSYDTTINSARLSGSMETRLTSDCCRECKRDVRKRSSIRHSKSYHYRHFKWFHKPQWMIAMWPLWNVWQA